jgi:N-acetylglucosaminyl-diphospho-decaprenol L-rhamnosyltransferase
MNNLSQLTIVIVTYKTNLDILKNCLNSINSKIKTLIIENSNSFEHKKEIQKQFSNVEILCTGSNMGYGAGNNFGLKEVNTKYALILNPDIICSDDFFLNILKYLEGNIDFSLIGSTYKEHTNYNPAGFFNNKDLQSAKFITEFNLYEVDWIAGHTILINFDKFKEKKIFDENFFLFFEELDLCRSVKKRNEKTFMSATLKVNHLGWKSSFATDKKFEIQSLKLRNWHYLWSMFYYNKKNFGYIFALKKSASRLFRSIVRIIYYLVRFNKKGIIIYTYRLLGLINSILLKKSWYRP